MSKTKLTLTEANRQLNALAKQQKDIVKEVIGGLKDVIKKQTAFKQISWTQYTPYFNDGDVCEFSVNEIDVILTKETAELFNSRQLGKNQYNDGTSWDDVTSVPLDDIKGDIDDAVEVVDHDWAKDVLKATKQIHKIEGFLRNNENALKEAFGDHTLVTVTEKGITTEQYEHD